MSSHFDLPTNLELLADAQLFLKEQFEAMAPESALTRSWDEFYRVYDTLIRRFAIKCGVRPIELDECTQEVWSAIVVALTDFEPDPDRGRFRSWLYQIVRSKATDLVRQRVRATALSLDDSRNAIDVPDPWFDDPAEEFERHWQRQLTKTVMLELRMHVSDASFRIFFLRRVRGRSTASVAQKLNLSEAAVRTSCHRTQQQFRRLMDRYTTDGE